MHIFGDQESSFRAIGQTEKIGMMFYGPRVILLYAFLLAFSISGMAYFQIMMMDTMPAADASPESALDDLYSDFNGDGYDDLAIGEPNSGGAVHVLYG